MGLLPVLQHLEGMMTFPGLEEGGEGEREGGGGGRGGGSGDAMAAFQTAEVVRSCFPQKLVLLLLDLVKNRVSCYYYLIPCLLELLSWFCFDVTFNFIFFL